MSLTKDVLGMTYINKVNCCDLYTCVTCASLICLNYYIKDVYIVPSIPQRAYDKRRQKKDKPFIFSEYEGLFSFIMSWSKAKKKTKNDKASNLNCTPFPKKRKGVQ